MVKSFAYILNAALLILLTSCSQEGEINFTDLTEEEKKDKIKSLELNKSTYHQGSILNRQYYDSLIALDPQNASYYSSKSIGLSKIGDYHKAFPLLQKAMELDPKETLYYTAWLMTDLYKDYDRALLYLNQYDEYTPGKVDYAWGENVNYLKGEVLQAMGHHQKAIKEFTIAIDEEGDYIDDSAYVYRGISFTSLMEYQKAFKDFDKAIKIYPKSSMAYFYKGLALLETKDTIEAINCLEKARDLIKQGYKKSDPYKEVYNEIYLMQVEDKLKEIKIEKQKNASTQ